MGRSRKRQKQGNSSASEKEHSDKIAAKRSGPDAPSVKRTRRLVGLLIIPSAVIFLVAAAFFTGNLWRGKQTVTAFQTNPVLADGSGNSSTFLVPDTKEYIMDFDGSILKENQVPEIQQLMEQYFLSITDCDMDTFFGLFTSQDTTEEEKYRTMFEKQREYIEDYQNINCYTVQGLDENSYVVYVSYDIKFVGVDTLGPDLVRVYVVKGDDGQYRIYDEPMTPELEDYLDQVSQNEDVRLLISQVDHQTEDAIAEDEELRKRITYLKNGPPYMQGEKLEIGGESQQAAGETEQES